MPDYKTHGWRKHGRSRRLLRQLLSGGAVKNLILLLVLLAILGSLGILGAFAFYSRALPDPAQLTERSISQTTKIYDRTGEHLLYEVYGEENRTLVKIQEGFCQDDPSLQTDPTGIPLRMLEATITAEDRTFCEHGGFSFTGLARAVFFLGRRGGGSTLTQQLVKNAILSNERRLRRKIKELIISIELERRYSKDEILQIYFNEIPYGSTYYGIQAAATNFYGRPVKDLTLGQMATLAAIPKAPTTYINNPDLLKARRDYILDGMVEQGFVTPEEAVAAKQEDTSLAVKVTKIEAPHFVFYVKEQLEETYGQYQAENGGLKVITSLDYDLQKIAEEEVVKGVDERGEQYGFGNGAMVALDPKTGQVLAMVGSKDYFDDDIDGQVNVTLRPRQPGSSIKPMVYTAGFEKGYTPNTIMWDVNTDFGNGYAPKDYDEKERGPLRVRQALQGSLNIPAVEMTYLVGVENFLQFAERLGYTTFGDRSRFGLSVGIGAGEVKMIEHAGAFAALANDGVQHAPVSILKVEGPDGSVLEEWKQSEGKKVLEPNVARLTSNVLSDNAARTYVFGATSYLQLGERPVAAKTGTTNDFYDAWTMGYTPSLVTGVWVGNSKYVAMKKGADGSVVAAPIWNAFMRRALEGKPIETFTPPEIPTTGKAIIDGVMPGTTVTIDQSTGKLATEYTPTSQRVETMFSEYHSILHYIDRADPLGAPPADSAADPQYANWEKAIQEWIARREVETGIKITQGVVPTEYDDVHVPENIPSVRITTPDNDTEVGDRELDIEVEADAPRGVVRLEFYLDGYFLGSDQTRPWSLHARIPNTVSRGYHTLKAVAYDDVDNAGSDTVGIRVTSEPASTGFEMLDPKSGQTIERASDTYTVVVSLDNPSDFALVSVYAQEIGRGSRQLVESKLDPSSPFITFAWTLPTDGDWALSATATPKGEGDRLETAGIIVHIVEPKATAAPAPAPEATDETASPDSTVSAPEPELLSLDPFADP
jgi:membrane peptidoglycan carboxypeptidase